MLPAPATQLLLSRHIAWEDDSTFEWTVRLANNEVKVDGVARRAVEAAPVGPRPQDRQLVLVTPTARSDLEQGASVGVARSVCWWQQGMPVYCKLVNRSKTSEVLVAEGPLARMVALNVRVATRFESLFDDQPSVVDPIVELPDPEVRPPVVAVDSLKSIPTVKVGNANMGTLGAPQKDQLVSVLVRFIEEGLFPIDPKLVPACVDGTVELTPLDQRALYPV